MKYIDSFPEVLFLVDKIHEYYSCTSHESVELCHFFEATEQYLLAPILYERFIV